MKILSQNKHPLSSGDCLHPTDHKHRSWVIVFTGSLMKGIKTCSRLTMSEEWFSDLAVIAMYYSERFEVEVKIRARRNMSGSLCKGSSKKALSRESVWLNRRVKKETNNYCCCTVLLVLNIVSHIWQIYTSEIKMKKIYISKHYPPFLLPHSFGPGMFALNSHTYNPLFDEILDQSLKVFFLVV